jgi:hypothetical protein
LMDRIKREGYRVKDTVLGKAEKEKAPETEETEAVAAEEPPSGH